MTGDFTVALHAAVFLSHCAQSRTSAQLAQNVCTNPAVIRRVMSRLRAAGLICSKEGHVGGYTLCRPADEITLCDILDAVESRVVEPHHTGSSDMDCLIASGMARVSDEITDKLNKKCRRELEKLTVGDIEKKIFSREAV